MSGSLPGVKVGPLDPDRTSDFGQVAATHSARTLIRLHSQAYPPALTGALALKQDMQRTQGLDMAEVSDYLGGLELENGDPAVPKDAVVEGAAVRGERDGRQVLTYTYRTANGRTAKWFAPYSEDALPKSFEEGAERVYLHDLQEKGLVAQAGSAAGERGTTRMASEAGDVRLAGDNDDLRGRLDELQKRLDEAEAKRREAERAAAAAPEPDADADDAQREPVASQEPPLEGYDDLKAADLAKKLKDTNTSEAEVQAVLDYERTHENRRSVVGAAEARLGANGRP